MVQNWKLTIIWEFRTYNIRHTRHCQNHHHLRWRQLAVANSGRSREKRMVQYPPASWTWGWFDIIVHVTCCKLYVFICMHFWSLCFLNHDANSNAAIFFYHVMLLQVVIFVMNKNKDNSSTDEPLVRFADLYHSANRTPMSSHDVTRHLTTWHTDGHYYPGIII